MATAGRYAICHEKNGIHLSKKLRFPQPGSFDWSKRVKNTSEANKISNEVLLARAGYIKVLLKSALVD